jgi:hypothetical protein
MPESSDAVRGFHGTSTAAANAVLEGGFQPSNNSYDWLGDGVYFFQDAPNRAWEWSLERYGSDAAVIGAEILLTDCMDLLDTNWTSIITSVYDRYLEYIKNGGHSHAEANQGSTPTRS